MKEQEETITTLNLNDKKGVNILKRRYDMMNSSILRVLKINEPLTLAELNSRVESDLREKFDGKIGWYLMAVKLDLEVRKVIERVPKTTPQKLRLVDEIHKQN